MAITRQTLLQAIDRECASRRGPTPVALVAIAANARSEADRLAVDEMLIEMRTERLLACVQDPIRGNGLVLTESGRNLAYQKAEKINTSLPEPAPPHPVSASHADSTDEPDGLPALLIELGQLLAERLEASLADDDMRQAIRLSEMSDRLMVHTRRLMP